MPVEKLRRKSLTSNQQKDLERLTQPKTPGELALALQNPNTQAYKDMMNMLFQQMETELIIEKLIDHYLVQQYVASQEEKAELIREMIRVEVAAQKSMQQLVPQMVQIFENKKFIAELGEIELKDRWQDRNKVVVGLRQDIETYKLTLDRIKQQEQINIEKWKEVVLKKRERYVDALIENKLVFKGLNGEEISLTSEKGKAIIDDLTGVSAPPPTKVFDMVYRSHQELAKTQTTALATEEDKFGKPYETGQVMLGQASVLGHIRALGKFGADNSNLSPSAVVQVEKDNQLQFGLASDSQPKPSFKIKKTGELLYKKSLLEQAKNDPTIDVGSQILNKEQKAQKTGILDEIQALSNPSGDAAQEPLTGPALLRALKEQRAARAASQPSPVKAEAPTQSRSSRESARENTPQEALIVDAIRIVKTKSKTEAELNQSKKELVLNERLLEQEANRYQEETGKVLQEAHESSTPKLNK